MLSAALKRVDEFNADAHACWLCATPLRPGCAPVWAFALVGEECTFGVRAIVDGLAAKGRDGMWRDGVLPEFTPWEGVFWARAGKGRRGAAPPAEQPAAGSGGRRKQGAAGEQVGGCGGRVGPLLGQHASCV